MPDYQLDVHVIPVTWASHEQPLRQIRQTVFVEEQSIPPALEFDIEDAEAHHVLALNSAGLALGCARLLANGLIGRVAVLQAQRNQGLGKSLVNALIEQAQNAQLTRVHLHAQAAAEAFYNKLEFRATGQTFMEAGIPHLTMERTLPIPFDLGGVRKSTIVRSGEGRHEPAESGENVERKNNLREFHDDTVAQAHLLDVLASARRSVRIYSPMLDHAQFETPAVVASVSRFARSAAGTRVDILLRNSSLIVSRGHELVELGRRLDQKMTIRRIPDSIKADAQSWLVVDNEALWVQSEPTEYRGWSDTWNPVQAERFSKRYTQLWDRSVPDPELRILRI